MFNLFTNNKCGYGITCVLSISILFFPLKAHCKETLRSSLVFEDIDFEEIANCTDMNRLVDIFIAVGVKYQATTSKKFNYKKILKKTVKVLKENNIDVDKKVIKEIKNQIHDRITGQFFHEKARHTTNKSYSTRPVPQQRQVDAFNDSFRHAVLFTGVGLIMIAVPCPVTQAIGCRLVQGGLAWVASETYSHLTRPGKDSNIDKDRDGKRPNMADRN